MLGIADLFFAELYDKRYQVIQMKGTRGLNVHNLHTPTATAAPLLPRALPMELQQQSNLWELHADAPFLFLLLSTST